MWDTPISLASAIVSKLEDAPATRRAPDYTEAEYAAPQALLNMDQEDEYAHIWYPRAILQDGGIKHEKCKVVGQEGSILCLRALIGRIRGNVAIA